MSTRIRLPIVLVIFMQVVWAGTPSASACAAISFHQVPVINADQSVIIIWDSVTGTEHFIRKASFKSAADELGFIVPTPSQPVLEEAGDEAFEQLRTLTKPEVKHQFSFPMPGITCTASPMAGASLSTVQVLQEKEVAGYKAAVLKAGVAGDLVSWLKDNGYAYSAAMEAWAEPYIRDGWKFTALKLAKSESGKQDKSLTASALRISFKTKTPLFPYREPDSTKYAEALGAKDRLLRIYFIADARYRGELTPDHPWSGKAVWANKLRGADLRQILENLKLPDTSGLSSWWLTEFEDHWPYEKAAGDLYFCRDAKQTTVQRPPIVVRATSPWPVDVTACALAAMLLVPPVISRWRLVRGA